MRRFILLPAAVACLGTGLAGMGCAGNGPATTASSAAGPDPRSAPKPGEDPGTAPARRATYDPGRPDINIDLSRFSSALAANDPRLPEWAAKKGLVARVNGIMGSAHTNPRNGYERFTVRAETGGPACAIVCELMALPDWRQVSPGRRVAVVGVLTLQDYGSRGIDICLTDATVVAASGDKPPEWQAEQIGKEYAANPGEFAKKWVAEGRHFYVTGRLKSAERTPLAGSPLFANRFVIAAGPAQLHCHIRNGRGVDADPPSPGDKVTVLAECSAADSGAVTLNGFYAGKGR